MAQIYKTIPRASKMDLRAFWRVVAMVSGLAVRPVSWFDCISVLLYVIYNNHPERKQHRKMKEKSAGEKYLADLVFLYIKHIFIRQHKSRRRAKFTKKLFLPTLLLDQFFQSFPIAFFPALLTFLPRCFLSWIPFCTPPHIIPPTLI